VPTAIVAFTRDLRLHDNPALTGALRRADRIVPAFVFDDAILTGRFNRPNRTSFLVESLADLDATLHERGAGLLTRRGDWVEQVAALAQRFDAETVHVSRDVSGFAQDRQERLARRLRADRRELVLASGLTVVPPGALAPANGDHFKVFTPYYRRWLAAPVRPLEKPPTRVTVPDGLSFGPLPTAADLVPGGASPGRPPGGETSARAALNAWARSGLAAYDDRHDDLPADGTSRISAALHFGCVSPLEIVTKLRGRAGAAPFVRQLCWRDFFHQVLAARPDAAWTDYRGGGFTWADDDLAFAAWTEGRTGYPVVDAAMRQLQTEGFVHNRARMITASFLTKDLNLDWRLGARHFLDWLVDGDVANNNLNWQWVAGTGTDANPHRIFNPTVQARRFDPDGVYVRRYLPELATLVGGSVHEPWKLTGADRAGLDYPEPIVEHAAAVAAYRARRASGPR
jgi:deoxyribodipyrimidine photo-lyase